MTPLLQRHLLPELLRLFAASQAMPLVVVHAAWMLLLAGAGGGEGAMGDLGKGLIRSFVWLGGVGPDGQGDESTIMLAWGKVALVVYAFDVLLRAVRGERTPVALWKLSLGSGAAAAVGMFFATQTHGLSGGERGFVTAFFGVFATGAAFWAIGLRRIAELAARRLKTRGDGLRGAA